ncbi:MAG TPA: 2-amino-4-hydroxy-6-hydroxymethyldihydropteridine diphosphokinase, partial [Candidatus Binatus sp.]|nr:2-amino-4-hydroxy-6-hydroxymethyldihydropteridine diphosphokinase [Candidatus Binatus sp.]
QPDFLNAVVALDLPAADDPTAGALDLLVALKRLERQSGRQRRRRWGPRELDLDLLLYGDHRIRADRPPAALSTSAANERGSAGGILEVPHPAMRDRLFVLAPLADLAPDLRPPGWPGAVGDARDRRVAAEDPGAVVAVGSWDGASASWGPLEAGTPGPA